MAHISRLIESRRVLCGSLNRWEKTAMLFCFCGIAAVVMQLVMPVIKSFVVLSLLTGTAENLWSSIYCSPCGSHCGKDFGSNTIAVLCWCDEPEKAMAILSVLLKKKLTQLNWPIVSYHLQQIDRKGKINGARWLELCRPFAEHQNRILEAQHKETDLDKRCDARYYRRSATFSLIAGYENHGLFLECESWYKKLITKEKELFGNESFEVREVMLKLANFYERHDRKSDAGELIEQLRTLEKHQDKYGYCWRIARNFTGGYKFERVDANNLGR